MIKENNHIPHHPPQKTKVSPINKNHSEQGLIKERVYPSFVINWSRKICFKLLKNIQDSHIIVLEDGQEHVFGNPTSGNPIRISVLNPQFYPYLVIRGSMGAGESYVLNYWGSEQFVALFQVLLRQQKILDDLETGFTKLIKPIFKLQHLSNKNTLKGSKRNISSHYDLSNAFYALWLDKSMTYSSGIFPTPEASLESSQFEKLDRICRKLKLMPGDHVLEIGTGWGSFSIHAAKYYGCKVTTTTISKAQYMLAKQRIQKEGLGHKITLLKKDYRLLEGKYDKLASIEMIEAVGFENIPEFIQVCDRLLHPNGVMALQAITMADKYYDQYLNDVDFIQKYIFPGGNLLSQAHLLNTIKDTQFRMVHLEDIALHYAQTLRHWRQRFYAQSEKIHKMGFSKAFQRLWEYYLMYCEAGFREQHIGTVQVILAKSENRHVDLTHQGLSKPITKKISVN